DSRPGRAATVELWGWRREDASAGRGRGGQSSTNPRKNNKLHDPAVSEMRIHVQRRFAAVTNPRPLRKHSNRHHAPGPGEAPHPCRSCRRECYRPRTMVASTCSTCQRPSSNESVAIGTSIDLLLCTVRMSTTLPACSRSVQAPMWPTPSSVMKQGSELV